MDIMIKIIKYFSTMYCIFPFFVYIFVLKLYFYNKVMKKMNIQMNYLFMIFLSLFISVSLIYRLNINQHGLPEGLKSERINNAHARESVRDDSGDTSSASSASLIRAGNISIFQYKNMMICIP
jgi:hypothetical protein